MSKPLVTVVVPHHLNENDGYLHWCLKSVLSSVGCDIEVICISDSEECPSVPDSVLMVHDHTLSNVTKKWHHGVKLASPHSKYVMLISDDVMVSKYTIVGLANAIGDVGMILGPASNCDATTRYRAEFYAGHKRLDLKMRMEDLSPHQGDIINFPVMTKILIDPGWISFYCTMFPKSVLQAVGDFDEKLDVRHNDVDYCHRARQLGIPSMINLGVFALHFGDRTLPKCTTPEEYQSADEAMRDKYRVL